MAPVDLEELVEPVCVPPRGRRAHQDTVGVQLLENNPHSRTTKTSRPCGLYLISLTCTSIHPAAATSGLGTKGSNMTQKIILSPEPT